MINKMSSIYQEHYKKLMGNETIRIREGVHYILTREDPFGDEPIPITQVMEYVVYSFAAQVYKHG